MAGFFESTNYESPQDERKNGMSMRRLGTEDGGQPKDLINGTTPPIPHE
jgi:hypothetical protein